MDNQKDLPLPQKDLPLPQTELPEPEKLLRAPTFGEKYFSSKWYMLSLLLILVVLFSGYYFFGGDKIVQQIIAPAATPTPTPMTATITPTPDPTAGWKTYINTKYRTSINYPPTWAVQDESAANSEPNVRFSFGKTQLTLYFSKIQNSQEDAIKSEIITVGSEPIPFTWYQSSVTQQLSAQTSESNMGILNENGIYAINFYLENESDLQIIKLILSSLKFSDITIPSCTPRPACLDSEPRCMIAETEDMCPPATSTPKTGDQVMCTMDAKLCADGSSVGRQGPNCEFAACPGE